ncbi:ras-domain-containing protein [Aulographum hederae CBS 113979]|uniref:Ras-domain-containing protein n=1 Tax=Aulographum hederae CBS 113979 TaxID=1176131 RepID=A0A6G1H2Q0_9PEZI|nr:ras-domain-containing protein [Aulographum hederae CBS 113979]
MSHSLEAKIVVLGSQGVGKTSLVHRYVQNIPPPTQNSTIGASFLTKKVVDIDSSTVVRLQIWDTAGQERFRSISKLYYRGANAALLCYDITSPSSFTEMGRWLLELRQNLPEDTILHVVGTKSDVVAEDPSKRQVPFERCIAYVAENLYPPTTAGTPADTFHSDPPKKRGHAATLSQTSFFGVGGGSRRELVPETPTGQAHDRERPRPLHARSQSHNNILDHVPDLHPSYHDRHALPSPHSNRSSGLWNQDLGWDSCHEISSTTGEGVEEVFRVITKRLVDQQRARQDAEASLLGLAGRTPGVGGQGGEDYFAQGGGPYGAGGGSFRVGYGDKRRSWMNLTPGAFGGGVGATPEGQQWERQMEGLRKGRGGRCC